MSAQPSAYRPPDPSQRGLVVIAVLVWAAAAWFYDWNPADPAGRWLTPQATSHYHGLTDGFLAGQLHLPIQPDPRMGDLADPYDPAANAPYRVNDLSYFSGRYYFYPSALPVLLLFAPTRLLTGQHLLESRACEVFVLGGLAASLLSLLVLQRRFFPPAPIALAVGGMAALALSQGYHVVLRAESYNLVPIACAYCWVMVSLWMLLRALGGNGSRRTLWLTAASLAYGLAIAARPNYLFGALALGVPAFVWWRANAARRTRSLLGWIAAIGAPLATIAAGLLAYNHARFGKMTEFGIKYQLGDLSTFNVGGLSLANVPANARHYFLGTGDYHLTFPFVTTSHWAALGVLWHVPVVILPLVLLPLIRGIPPLGRAALLLPGIVAAANLGFLLFFPNASPALLKASANARYLLDFLPAWVLLAAGSGLAAGSAWRAQPLRRWLLPVGAALLLAISILAAISLDLGRIPPEAYRPFARLMNLPVWQWQQAQGLTHGPLEIELLLPANKPGAYEPLLTTGTSESGTLLFVFYESPKSIRLGIVTVAARGPVSESIAVDYRQPHRFEVHLGSLYPDISHPLLASYPPAQVARLKRWLVVRLDGRTVFEVPVHLPVARSTSRRIGTTDFLQQYSGERFTGRILGWRALPLPAPVPSEPEPEYGPIRIRLRFPPGKGGQTEPLISTGIPLAGDLLAVTYGEGDTVRFLIDHWGHSSVTTDWIRLAPGTVHELEVSMGSLYPPPGDPRLRDLSPGARQRQHEHAQLQLDGRIIFDAFRPTFPSSAFDVFVGRNVLGSSVASEVFTGEILSVERAGPPVPAR